MNETLPYLLVGAGGHARVVAEMISVRAYVDPKPSPWFDGARHYATDEEALRDVDPEELLLAIGLGGTTTEQMKDRTELAERYAAKGLQAPALIHPRATVGHDAVIGEGTQIHAGTVVHPGARIGTFCLINSQATIAHSCVIGDGVHISLGAILGGGVKVGRHCMIGAGAVLLPFCEVSDGTLVKAATRYPR